MTTAGVSCSGILYTYSLVLLDDEFSSFVVNLLELLSWLLLHLRNNFYLESRNAEQKSLCHQDAKHNEPLLTLCVVCVDVFDRWSDTVDSRCDEGSRHYEGAW